MADGSFFGSWDIGGAGNSHSFTKADGSMIPAGEYVLELLNTWNAAANQSPYDELKKQTLRLASPVKVAVEAMTHSQAIRALSKGTVDWSQKGSCPAYIARDMGAGKSLAEYAALATAAGASQFAVSLDQKGWSAYWCDKGAFTPDLNNWSGLMDIYDVLPWANPMPAATAPADATTTNGGTGNTPPTPAVVPAPAAVPVANTATDAWVASDPNLKLCRDHLATQGWTPYTGYDYRVLTKLTVT